MLFGLGMKLAAPFRQLLFLIENSIEKFLISKLYVLVLGNPLNSLDIESAAENTVH